MNGFWLYSFAWIRWIFSARPPKKIPWTGKHIKTVFFNIIVWLFVLNFSIPFGLVQDVLALSPALETWEVEDSLQYQRVQAPLENLSDIVDSPASREFINADSSAYQEPDIRGIPVDLNTFPEKFELRTSTSATFQGPGGVFHTIVSTEPMHYLNESGNWEVIQPVFQQMEDSFVVTRNSLMSRAGLIRPWMSGLVGETAAIWEVSELGIRDERGNYHLLANALTETPYPAERQFSSSLLHYVGGWSDSSLVDEITSGPGTLEYSLILEKQPQYIENGETLELRAMLEILPGNSLWIDGEQVRAETNTNDVLEIRDSFGKPSLVLSAVVGFEQSNPVERVSGAYLVTPGDSPDTWMVRIQMPLGWLLDPARVYPVVIDPEMRVVKSTGYADGMGWVRSNDTQSYTLGGIRLGAHLPYWDTKSRGYVQFNSLPSLLSNSSFQVLSASLDVTPDLPPESMPLYKNSPVDWEHEKIKRNTELYYLGACPDSPGCNGLSFLDNTLNNPAYNWSNSPLGTLVDTKVLKAGPASGGGKLETTTYDVTSQIQNWYNTYFIDKTARPGPTFMLRFPDTPKENCPAAGPYYFGYEPGTMKINTSWEYVPYCIWLNIPTGNVQLRIAYQALPLSVGDNLLNTPGVPSYLDGVFENTHHQYLLTPAVSLNKHWRGIAVQGNHDFEEALPTRVGLQVVDYTTDPSNPEILANGVTKGPAETAFIFLDDHAPATIGASGVDLRAEVSASEQPAPNLEMDYLSDLSRNYRVDYQVAVNQTFTYGEWSPLGWGSFSSDQLISMIEFNINEGDNFIIRATAPITLEIVLVEPSGATSHGDAVLGNTDAKVMRNLKPKESIQRTTVVGAATAGKWAVAAINQARPYVCPDPPQSGEDCEPGGSGILFPFVEILACPIGSIPTAHYKCQPLILPDNTLPDKKSINLGGHIWEIFSEGHGPGTGFEPMGGDNWCTRFEDGGAPIIGPQNGVNGRWVFVAQGRVCYQNGVLSTSKDSAVGLATPVENFDPNNKYGQFPPGFLYGDPSQYPYQSGFPHGNLLAASDGLLVPNDGALRWINPFEQYWEEEYIQNPDDAISTKNMWLSATGTLETWVTYDINQPPQDSVWDIAWQLWPNQPGCLTCEKYTFFPLRSDHLQPLSPQPLPISGMEVRILQQEIPTGELNELQSLNTSTGPVAYQFHNPSTRVTLVSEIGGTTQNLVSVIQPRGIPRMPKNQSSCMFEGDPTSCLDIRPSNYAWNNGKGEKNVQPWLLPDIHIEGMAGSVMVSTPGMLSVFSADHPASLMGFSQTFSFDTWEVTAEIEESACNPGETVTTVVRGHGYIGLPTIGGDGSGPPPWIEVDFKLCSTELRQAHLELAIPPPGLPVGSTGIGVHLVGGTITVGPDSTEIKLEVGFQTLDGYLFTDGAGTVTINTDGMFSLKASGKLVGKAIIANQVLLEVAWNPLDVLVDAQVSYKSVLWGSLRMHTWVGSGWQNKYPWIQDSKTHFTGQIGATVQIPKGELINKKYLKVPPFSITISAEVAFGEFCNQGGCAPPYPWGMSATVKVFGYGVGVYVDKSGPEIFIGSSSHKLIDQFGSSASLPLGPDTTLIETASVNSNIIYPGSQQAYLAPPFKTPTDIWSTESAGLACNGDGTPFVTCEFGVLEGTGKAFFAASWQNGSMGVTLIKPDGTEITSENAISHGVIISSTQDTNLKMVTFAAEPVGSDKTITSGDWEIQLSNVGVGLPAGYANNYKLMFAADPPVPNVIWTTPASNGVEPDGNGIVNLTWDVLRGSNPIEPGVVMELFYIPIAQKPITPNMISGSVIANQLQSHLGNYAWDTKGLASGEYAIGALIDDHLNANGHIVSWAPGTIVINDTTPPPVPLFAGIIAVKGGAIITWWKDLVTPDLAGYLVDYTFPDWDLTTPLQRMRRVIPGANVGPGFLDLFERVRLGGLPITISIPINTEICVRAYDASGNVSDCEVVVYTMPEALDERLGPVSAFYPGNTYLDGIIDLYWDVPTFGNADGYLLGYKPTRCLLPGAVDVANEGPPPIVLYPPPFDFTLSGLTPGQWYKFWIQPFNYLGDIGPAVSTEGMVLEYADSDLDGMADQWEALFGIDDPYGDEDLDLLYNVHEFQLGTNPLDADSDGDGFYDGEESNPELDLWVSDPCGPDTPKGNDSPKLAVFGNSEINFITSANLPAPEPQYIPVMNLGGGAMTWTVETFDPWIILDEPTGDGYGVIPVRVDLSKVRSSFNLGQITITGRPIGRTRAEAQIDGIIIEQVNIQVSLEVLPPKILEVYLPFVIR